MKYGRPNNTHMASFPPYGWSALTDGRLWTTTTSVPCTCCQEKHSIHLNGWWFGKFVFNAKSMYVFRCMSPLFFIPQEEKAQRMNVCYFCVVTFQTWSLSYPALFSYFWISFIWFICSFLGTYRTPTYVQLPAYKKIIEDYAYVAHVNNKISEAMWVDFHGHTQPGTTCHWLYNSFCVLCNNDTNLL